MSTPKKNSTRLLEAMQQLDQYITSEESATKASVVNALALKVSVFKDLIDKEREDEQANLAGKISTLEAQLAAYGDFAPESFADLQAELGIVRAENARLQSQVQALTSERIEAKSQATSLMKIVRWVCDRVGQVKKFTLALACFNELGADGKVLIDTLMGADTFKKWTRLSGSSEESLVELYRNCNNDLNQREFVRNILKTKGIDVDDLLHKRAVEQAKKDLEEAQAHEARVQAREAECESRYRDQAAEVERVERGLPIYAPPGYQVIERF